MAKSVLMMSTLNSFAELSNSLMMSSCNLVLTGLPSRTCVRLVLYYSMPLASFSSTNAIYSSINIVAFTCVAFSIKALTNFTASN